jgi:hypothetical protein
MASPGVRVIFDYEHSHGQDADRPKAAGIRPMFPLGRRVVGAGPELAARCALEALRLVWTVS